MNDLAEWKIDFPISSAVSLPLSDFQLEPLSEVAPLASIIGRINLLQARMDETERLYRAVLTQYRERDDERGERGEHGERG